LADNFSYNDNVQLFISAGNDAGPVGSPGKSHNALTVGAYDDTTDTIGDFSSWINPATGAMKPEILAPGVGLDFAGGLGTDSGTSFATPLAAGMAASNISYKTAMKKHPALIKASMLAMATKSIEKGLAKPKPDGAMAVQWNPRGLYFWWDEPNSFLDDADGQWKLLGSYYLKANEKVKVAFSWSNRQSVCDGISSVGAYPAPESHLCMELDMKVLDPSGNTVVLANQKNSNWEYGYIDNTVAGYYKVYVTRERNTYERTITASGTIGKQTNRAKLGLRFAYIDNE
jgi:hypothetical protein